MKERDIQMRKINQTKIALEELIVEVKNLSSNKSTTPTPIVNVVKTDDQNNSKQVSIVGSIGKSVENFNSQLNNLNNSIRNITDNEKNYQTNNMEILDYICQQQLETKELL